MKSKVIKIIAIVLPILMVVSCTDDDDNGNIIEGNNSIIDYLDTNSEFSTFRKAIDRAGLSGLLQGNSGSFTVFAPDNDSFDSYFQDNQPDSLADLSQREVEQLVDYHILLTLNSRNSFSTSYLKTRGNVPVNDSTETRLSLFVEVSQDSLIKLNENTAISEADIQVDNGILHKIDGVLAPPVLATFMQADENLTAFYDELISANSSDFQAWIADTTGINKTLFVPNNDAVAEYLSQNSGFSENTLRNHFMDSLKISTEFNLGYTKTLAQKNLNGGQINLDLYINNQIGLVLNDTASITVADIVATNGVLQITDKVLILPRVANFIKADVNLNALEDAFELDQFSDEDYFSLLEEQSSNQSPFTVFAPNNNAFDDLLIELFPNMDAGLDEIPEMQLQNILETHIVPQNQLVAPFNNQTVNSLNGESLMLNANQVNVGPTSEADLSNRNAQAINGVLHRIDSVLVAE
jgi:uncharacterized surface protein with fasciclin (FAS1) repeats